jgi:hypothetical protein
MAITNNAIDAYLSNKVLWGAVKRMFASDRIEMTTNREK